MHGQAYEPAQLVMHPADQAHLERLMMTPTPIGYRSGNSGREDDFGLMDFTGEMAMEDFTGMEFEDFWSMLKADILM